MINNIFKKLLQLLISQKLTFMNFLLLIINLCSLLLFNNLKLALRFERLDTALQQKVGALAARELALGSNITGHSICLWRGSVRGVRRGASWAADSRCEGSA